MNKHWYILPIFILALISCSSDDDLLSEEQPNHVPAGAYEEECKWIYSQMNHYYLWRNDLPDSLSCDYSTDPVTFYKSILSPKDRFSYCKNNTSYNPASEYRNSGFEYQTYRLDDGNIIHQVLYVTNEALREKGLHRGDFLFIDNNCNQIIRVRNKGNTIMPTDTIETSAPFDPTNTVYLDSIYTINGHKIGYLCYLQFESTDDLVPSLKRFYDARIDEMILDLRYNPGGYVHTCKYLSNSFVNEKGYNEIFQQCTYNDVLTGEYEKATGSGITINSFTTPDNGVGVLGNPLYGLNLKRLYVLTSKYSASASEAAIISMRPFMDVILIGEQTYGKGFGSWTIHDDRFRYQLQPITMRYHNAIMETTPDDGLVVDYYVPDGYDTRKKDLGDIQEPLLAKAIELITGTDAGGKTGDAEAASPVRARSEHGGLNITEIGVPSFFSRFNGLQDSFQLE